MRHRVCQAAGSNRRRLTLRVFREAPGFRGRELCDLCPTDLQGKLWLLLRHCRVPELRPGAGSRAGIRRRGGTPGVCFWSRLTLRVAGEDKVVAAAIGT